MRIRWHYLLVILGVGLLPLLVAGFLGFRSSEERLNRAADENLALLATLISGELNQYVVTVGERIRARSLYPEVVNYVRRHAAGETGEDIPRALDSVHNVDPINITSVALFDQRGIKLADTDAALRSQDESGAEWVRQPLEGRGVAAIPDTSKGRAPALYVSAPIRLENGEVGGVLRVRMQLAAIQQIVQRLSTRPDTFAVVVDHERRILAHGRSPETIGSVAPFSLPTGETVATISGEPLRHGDDDKTPYFVSSVDLKRVPWTVAVLQAEGVHSNAASELQRIIWLLAMLAVVLSIASSLIVSHRLTHPIRLLAETAEKIDEGHLSFSFPSTGPHEVKTLAYAFNAMTDRLRHALAEIERRLGELRTSERHLRELIDASPVAMVVAATDGTVVQVNQAFEQLFGYGSKEVPTLSDWWMKLFPDVETRERFIMEMSHRVDLARENPQAMDNYEAEVHAFDGSSRFVGFRARSIGPMQITVCLDLTARRNAELEVRTLNAELEERVAARTLQLSNANAELESFSYAVSHDLRAPLRALDGFSRALEEDYGTALAGDGVDYLRRIRAASQRMGLLIDDLLKLSRVTRAEIRRESFDLAGVFRSVIQQHREAEPEREVRVQSLETALVTGDRNLIKIAVENLVSNAFKYSRKKPSTELEFGIQNVDTQEGPARAFFLRDNGAGFDMRYAGKLFGAFQRMHSPAEFEGTGVGLATVRRIISRHGGKIWADSKVGEGTTFYFTLDTPHGRHSDGRSMSPFRNLVV